MYIFQWALIILACVFSTHSKDADAMAVEVGKNNTNISELVVNEETKPEPDEIRLFFYPNKENVTDTEEFSLENPESILNLNFSKGEPLKILIHGFNGDCQDQPFPIKALEEYLLLKTEEKTIANIICVDWEPWSRFNGVVNSPPTYLLARIKYAKIISRKVTKLILFLRDAKMIKSLSDVHLIGDSLGAHISGSTGFQITELTGQKLGRISGLDPAGPLYREWPDMDEQIDRSDADFVDIYHTSMRRSGLEGKYGHVDFYINGGVSQPSCSAPQRVTQLFESIYERVVGGCAHNIVGNFWADTIRKEVKACKTESYAEFRRIKKSKSGCTPEDTIIFGENVPTSARGKYFLDLDTKFTPDLKNSLY